MNASTLFAAIATLAFAGSAFAADTPAADAAVAATAAAAAQAAVAAQAVATQVQIAEKSARAAEEKRTRIDANHHRRATEASQFDWIMR